MGDARINKLNEWLAQKIKEDGHKDYWGQFINIDEKKTFDVAMMPFRNSGGNPLLDWIHDHRHFYITEPCTGFCRYIKKRRLLKLKRLCAIAITMICLVCPSLGVAPAQPRPVQRLNEWLARAAFVFPEAAGYYRNLIDIHKRDAFFIHNMDINYYSPLLWWVVFRADEYSSIRIDNGILYIKKSKIK